MGKSWLSDCHSNVSRKDTTHRIWLNVVIWWSTRTRPKSNDRLYFLIIECEFSLRDAQSNFTDFLRTAHHTYTYVYTIQNASNVEVEWLTLLLRIREVPVSNLGLENGYPDWGYSCFRQSLQANARMVPKIRPWPLPSTSIPIHYSHIIPHSTLYSLRYWESVAK
jgi:hypothetical protein